jgi:hydrogenase maturation protein HypF
LVNRYRINQTCRKDIFAAGADLKNTFCFAKQNQLICSEHIGDLEDAAVYHHYIKSIEHLRRFFEVEPEIVVCDLHPAYLSTQYAKSIPSKELIEVQHHWAHIASVLAENNLAGPVIGLACDGTGYGSDGAVWGCECLTASLSDFQRFGHLDYFLLPGGDKASKEAIRPVLSLLKKTYAEDFNLNDFQWLLARIEPGLNKQQLILQQLEKQVNTIPTSSLGRVFDAVAAMAGLGAYNNFEAQLPMALEAVIEDGIDDYYDFEIIKGGKWPLKINLSKMVKQLVYDIEKQVLPAVISAKFHNCSVAALLEMAEKNREKTGLQVVALSGGVFCNRYLLNRLINLLKKSDFSVLFNKDVPSNDGGISIGQAAIAANIVTSDELCV